jgi:transcriptional regulator with XRE-family HTH domain
LAANSIDQDAAPPDPATGSSAAAPQTLEQSIGAQVRALRRQSDLTLADVAAAAGVSAGMLSKIENGQISPSLATLQGLAAALHVPVTALFAAFEEKRDCSFVRAGQGVVIERRGSKAGHQYSLLGHALGGAVAVEPYLITLVAEAAPHVGFRHEGVEFIYMLTGEVVYRHADRSYHLRPGDALLFDSAALHGPERLIETPMTYLSIIIHARKPE